jgi:type IV pilus assembly protein PilN
MIRINLLQVDRERVRAKASTFQLPGQRITLACSLIVVATGLGILWWWWALDRQSVRLDADIVAAERETARLKTLIHQVETFEKQKQQLQQRVALIEELRQGQGAPVRMLDEISRAVPDVLWLTALTQDVSGELTITGKCATLTALSDFVGNLERSGFFKRPVEIIDSVVENAAPPVGELIKFSIKAQFQMPGLPATNAAAIPANATEARTAAKR